MSLSSTDDKALTGVGGTGGGRGPGPRREIIILLILILAGVIYICVVLTKISQSKEQLDQSVPASALTGTDTTGGKHPGPK